MKNYKLAIVGATGVVGRTALKVLEEKNLPISEYVLFASNKSAGKKVQFMNKEYIIQELTEHSFDEELTLQYFPLVARHLKNMLQLQPQKVVS